MQAITVTRVQQSWALVQPIAREAAALFYQNLFDAHPGLRRLFRSDMEQQGAKLMFMIGAAVRQLDDVDTLLPVLAGLGRRHGSYGVMPAHYDMVGQALLKTLSQGLGDAFTPEVERAWAEVYGVIASTMIEASAEATTEANAAVPA